MSKKVIIIGASSGIGEQVAKDMASQGYCVGIVGRREHLLHDIQQQYPTNIIIKTIDIQEHIVCLQKIDALVQELGGLDILLLSAGTGKENFDLDFSKENETIQTNIVGWTNIMDWATTYFIHQGFGHLIAITSIAGLRGSPSSPAYSATKAYQSLYLESLRLNIDKRGLPIHILEVQPGFIDTAMAQGKLFWVSTVHTASYHIRKAIHDKKSHIYISKRRAILAWIIKFLPYCLYKKIITRW